MNLHPMVIHFPIALLIVGFLFVSVSMFCKKCAKADCDNSNNKPSCIVKSSFWLLVLGTLSAIAAILTGIYFTEPMIGPLGVLRDTHQMLAVSTVTVAVITSVIFGFHIYKTPSKQLMIISYSLYALCAILVAITGHYGGEIVYMFR